MSSPIFKDLLPTKHNKECVSPSKKCFYAGKKAYVLISVILITNTILKLIGDDRSTEQPGLTSLHTGNMLLAYNLYSFQVKCINCEIIGLWTIWEEQTDMLWNPFKAFSQYGNIYCATPVYSLSTRAQPIGSQTVNDKSRMEQWCRLSRSEKNPQRSSSTHNLQVLEILKMTTLSKSTIVLQNIFCILVNFFLEFLGLVW